MPKASASSCRSGPQGAACCSNSRKLPGKVTAGGAAGVNPDDYDLVGLAMQEPQYRSPGVRELLDAVAKSQGAVHVDHEHAAAALREAHSRPRLRGAQARLHRSDRVGQFRSRPSTLCSPDPQAIRPPDGKANELLVTLPTNFKVARIRRREGHAILRQLEKEIDAVRFDPGDGNKIELPVKLRCYNSIFVPLAKWAMLLAGNYRCITKDGMRTAQEAVHTDLDESTRGLQFRVRSVRQARRQARTTWCRSRNMPQPRRACRVRPRPRARCRTARPTSSAPTSWCSSSPGRRA